MQKIKSAVLSLKGKVTLTQILSVALISVAMSNGELFGSFSPFCAAFAAALAGYLGMVSFASAFIGYIAFSRLDVGLTYITVMLFMITLGVFFESFDLRQTRRSKVIFVSAALLICDIASGAFFAHGAVSFLYVLFDVALCGTCTYFFCNCIDIVKKETFLSKISASEQFTLSVVFVILISNFSSFRVGFFDMGRIAGIIFVLWFSQKRKVSSATFAATLVLIGICLYDTSLASASMLIIFCAIFSAYASSYGKAAQILAFSLTSIAGSLLFGVNLESVNFLCDVLVGTIAYIFMPATVLYIDKTELLDSAVNSANFASSKLLLAAGAIEEIKEEITNVSRVLEHNTARDISWVGEQTTEKICKNCKNNAYCWQEKFDGTAKAMSGASMCFNQKQTVTVSDLPQYLKQNCTKTAEIASELNGFYESFVNNKRTEVKLRQMRSLLCEQLDTTRMLFEQMSEELVEKSYIDEELSSDISEYLRRAGMKNAKVKVTVDRGFMKVEGYCSSYSGIFSAEEIREGLTERLGSVFDLPQIYTVKNITKIVANETPRYYAEINISGTPKNQNDVSGDKVESFSDGAGNFYICLSDGMGSGKRAAVDSDMACSALYGLLRSGIEISTAIRLLNSSMMVKSGDESFATIDICKINLRNGKAELIKAGAVASYLKTGNSVVKLDASTLPVGMLNKVAIKKKEIQLTKNDMLIMVSDGAVCASTDWLRSALEKIKTDDTALVADGICALAAETAPSEEADDITVVAIKLCENSKK